MDILPVIEKNPRVATSIKSSGRLLSTSICADETTGSSANAASTSVIAMTKKFSADEGIGPERAVTNAATLPVTPDASPTKSTPSFPGTGNAPTHTSLHALAGAEPEVTRTGRTGSRLTGAPLKKPDGRSDIGHGHDTEPAIFNQLVRYQAKERRVFNQALFRVIDQTQGMRETLAHLTLFRRSESDACSNPPGMTIIGRILTLLRPLPAQAHLATIGRNHQTREMR
ncbi:hypothetical protein L2Y96_12715 [Luteibacter aegosomaticola]|uniref:hypothetical protein n=1 Tax=Luteibacter aegosomaticola TaxID=2911538 RepID=UPI001FF92AD4|nr:hypothetical protein [Luteibacter aegosomaticola]UPG88282.1 hypothetical protein L2Y96_12715 [Luteibacter aegosomaticola]